MKKIYLKRAFLLTVSAIAVLGISCVSAPKNSNAAQDEPAAEKTIKEVDDPPKIAGRYTCTLL